MKTQDWGNAIFRAEGVTLNLPAELVDKYGLDEASSAVEYILRTYVVTNRMLLEEFGKEWYDEFLKRVFDSVA